MASRHPHPTLLTWLLMAGTASAASPDSVPLQTDHGTTSVFAAVGRLPEPAIPGLRYYYPPEKVEPRVVGADVCVYGGTSGGVVAAIQAQRMGRRAVVLTFGKHVGGMTSGGLSHTDQGGPLVCGGIAREFYNQAGQANFRPSVAEKTFRRMLEESRAATYFQCQLARVNKQGTRITSIVMENGLEVKAAQFIDASYEGDLMARAGVSYTWGREPGSQYGETHAGIRALGSGTKKWPVRVDPYVVAGDPSSGLLPRIVKDTGQQGEGDKSVQAYNFRMRVVTHEDRLPFPKPRIYDLRQYELLARLFEAGADPNPVFNVDINNHHLFGGAYFTDFVAGNYGWPEGDYAAREQIFQDHANYQIGVMYFLANSTRVPEKWRAFFRKHGLPADEFQDTGGWPHEIYVREARRMVGEYVMTEHNCLGRKVAPDPIGLASYWMDSHNCQMGVLDGAVANEGDLLVHPPKPYPVGYGAITPKRSECMNLLVPAALSASHVAFGSIRMEPVFMILGQSAATAACLAMEDDVPVQDVDYAALRQRLLADQQILKYEEPAADRHKGVKPGILN